MTALYETRNLAYRYKLASQSVEALREINLDVQPGEFLAVAGPSGSGKTTLLNILGLLDRPCQGTIRYKGKSTVSLTERECTAVRRNHIGFIFQNCNTIPTLTAFENVEYFLLGRGLPHVEVRRRVVQMLDAVGVLDQANKRPPELSGGQRQRVAIAAALVRSPSVVLADEPTASLDHQSGLAAISLMRQLNRQRGATFIFSTHDPKAIALADRVVRLCDGRIVP